jgi:hypothetical protein
MRTIEIGVQQTIEIFDWRTFCSFHSSFLNIKPLRSCEDCAIVKIEVSDILEGCAYAPGNRSKRMEAGLGGRLKILRGDGLFVLFHERIGKYG